MNFTNEQKDQVLNRLFGAYNPNEVIVKQDGFINKEAAELLLFVEQEKPEFVKAYGPVFTKSGVFYKTAYKDFYGIPIEKAASDYTGALNEFATVTDWRGTGYMAEQTATKFWNFVLNVADPFLKIIGFELSKRNPTPVNLIGMIEENLMSSVRSDDGQPGTNLKKQVARFRKNMLAMHIEMQFDMQYEDIVNNLDEPDFVTTILTPVMIGYANDILRLFENGTTYNYSGVTLSSSYTRDDMYKLLQGHNYKIQNSSGSWTADQVSIVLGVHGKEMTANKYAIDATGTVSKFAPTFVTTESFAAIGFATVTAPGGNKLRVADGTGGGICYGRRDGIEVIPNKNATLTVTFEASDGSQITHVDVYDNAGNVLVSYTPVTGITVTTQAIPFFTRNCNFVQLRFHSVGNGHYTEFYDVTLNQEVAKYSGFEIQDIMDKLIEMRRAKYSHLGGYAFIMGKQDISAYAESKSYPIQITPIGTYVSANNTTREQWRVNGVIPDHRGHQVIFHPFKHSISEAKTYGGNSIYGSIYFMLPSDLRAVGLIGNFPFTPLSTKEFKARGKHGGAEVEYTKHAWCDTELSPPGRICIAYQGATCETPVLMQTDDPKAEPCDSGTTTAADGAYVFCDTPGARTFMSTTANVAEIGTLALAIAGIGGNVFEITEGTVVNLGGDLTAVDWSFRSFKDGYLIKSSIATCDFQ